MDQDHDAGREAASPKISDGAIARTSVEPIDREHEKRQRKRKSRAPQKRPESASFWHPKTRRKDRQSFAPAGKAEKSSESGRNTDENRGKNGSQSIKPEIIDIAIENCEKQNHSQRFCEKKDDPDIAGEKRSEPAADQKEWMKKKCAVRQRSVLDLKQPGSVRRLLRPGSITK